MADNSVSPKPDPWDPPRAAAAQAASIATGATGVALMLGDQPQTGGVVPEAMLTWLPDPNQIFTSMAHFLGFNFSSSDAWSWGFALVILSVALNIYSYLERYIYAKRVKPLWDEQIPRLEREAKLGRELQAARPQPRAQGSGGGAA